MMPRSVKRRRQVPGKRLPVAFFILAVLCAASAAQELPNKIRGYKVHRTDLSVANDEASAEKRDASVYLEFGDPEFSDLGLDGVTFLVPGSLTAEGKSGKIEFLTFRDFTVNGLPVEIREYRDSFDFHNGEMVSLPKPLEITVSIPSAIRGAADEIDGGSPEWEVKGRIFVFGRFKKYGFSFKRVVPVDVAFRVPNPLK